MPALNFKGTNKYQKFTELMMKKTHFSETEINRLADVHNQIMVNIFNFMVFTSLRITLGFMIIIYS